jgi:hypothetical protein
MILGLQIIALIFILIMLYFTYLHLRRGEINGLEAAFLLLAWSGAVLITIFPKIFSSFSETISVSRAFDLAVLGGFVFVIPIIYSSYIRTKRMENKFEEFIRKDALKQLKTSDKKKFQRKRS